MNYLKIEYEDVCNGTGLRCTIWFTSCSHKCKGCFNEESWNADNGIPFDESIKQKVFNELSKDYISGITLTGGDPLHVNNLLEILSLVREIYSNFPDKTIWLYTGYTWEEIIFPVVTNDFNLKRDLIISLRKQIIDNIDVLVDGKYDESKKDLSLAFRGSSNQRIIDVQKTLKRNEIVLYEVNN